MICKPQSGNRAMGASRLSCIICAHNEAPRIASVLRVAATHPLLDEVIVVDDGSTDETADIVRSFPYVRLLWYRENRGKSRAFADGVRAARCDYIMQLDADLKHLTEANISELAEPVLARRSEMSISVRRNSLAVYRWMGLDFVSGERVIPKRIVAGCLAEIDRLPRFGVEAFINARAIDEGLRIVVVRFDNVINTRKSEKIGRWRGMLADWGTALDVLRVISPLEVVRQNRRMLSLARPK
jgi:glycosyltransferase involved in cell wall biosynthesis